MYDCPPTSGFIVAVACVCFDLSPSLVCSFMVWTGYKYSYQLRELALKRAVVVERETARAA